MAKKRHYSSKAHMGGDLYAGVGSRREMEAHDYKMISEDRSAVANLPQNVVMKQWPKAAHYVDYGLDDTIGGINRQIDKDSSKMKSHMQPEKY